MSNIIITQEQSMTSVQIAEATGKQHSNVMRDIRNMAEKIFNQFKSESVKKSKIDNGGYSIEESSYTDAKGQSRSTYVLNGKAVLLLASGYNVVLRAKIIDKLEELNAQVKLQEAQGSASCLRGPSPAEVEASLRWIEGTRQALRLDGESTWKLAVSEAHRLGLPEPPRPDRKVLRERPPRTATTPWSASEVEFGDAWDTAAALLRRFGYAVTPAAFNARMVEKGWMAKLEFYNHSGRKVKTLMLCDQGVRYGRNVATEGTRSIAYCADLFPKLMHKIGLDDSDNDY